MLDVKDVTDKNFGVLIAFALPGFIFLWGISFTVEEYRSLLVNLKDVNTSVGGFFTITLASLAVGMILSAVRWALFDVLLLRKTAKEATKIKIESLRDDKVLSAFQGAVENHYRYYQYYSNTFVAVVLALVAHCLWGKTGWPHVSYLLIGALSVVLFFASWDSFNKFVKRAITITDTDVPEDIR